MPCKHFLAVMRLYPEWSWLGLPSQYLDSPFFNTDNDVCSKEFHQPAKDTLCDTVKVHQMSENTTKAVIEVVHPLQKTSFPKRSKAAACREVLGQLKSLTYLVDDDEAISELLAGLIDLKEDLQSYAPQEDGIDLVKRSRKPLHTTAQSACKIPARSSKKNPMSGRVGKGATRKRKAQSLKIENDKVETDVVETHDLLQMYELPDCFKDYLLKDDNNLGQYEINDAMLSEIDNKSQNLVENGVLVKQNSNCRKADAKEISSEVKKGRYADEDIIGTVYIPPHKTGKPKRRLNLKYSTLERQEILNDHMLTDMTINFAQNILLRDFPTISGL